MNRRTVLKSLAAGGLAGRYAIGSPADIAEEKLWVGDDAELKQAPYVPGMKHVMVHRAQKGEYQYLHGPQIIAFKGVLFTSWANSLINENSSSEAQRGRRSKDGGKTWSKVEVIAPNLEGRWRRSHGAFFIHEDRLYSMNGKFGNVSYEDGNVPTLWGQSVERGGVVFEGLQTEFWLLNQQTDKWEYEGVMVEDFWPYHELRQLSDGRYILAGMNSRFQGTVAISREPRRIDRWETKTIPVPEGMLYGEATCWVDGSDHIEVMMRNDTPKEKGGVKRVMMSHSYDRGKTWSVALPANFPHTAKPHAGILSTGQRYLVSNSSGTSIRWPLTIAVSAPGERVLRRNWRIRDGKTIQPRFDGKHKNHGWQYPGVWEHESNVYVIYSVGKEDCEVAILPLNSLQV